MSRPERVLIVDDEPNLRLMFRSTLEPSGYEVAEAADGRAGLEQLGSGPFDLVLLDLQMPEMGGLEALEAIRRAGHDVPVVIVTAHGSVPDAVAAMRLGAIDFLEKPLTPETLRRVVAEVILRHRPGPDGKPVPVRRPEEISAHRELIEEAKRAINRRHFEEAEVLLHHAADGLPDMDEIRDLLRTIRKVREQREGMFYAVRSWV